MYNITIFRDYILKKPFFTTVFYFFIIFTFFMIPVSAELLEESYEGVNIYSDVNNSWDYSTRYELTSIKEVESYTDFTTVDNAVDHYDCTTYENLKPTSVFINFDLHSGIKKIIAESIHVVDTGFIEGTSFHLMNGSESIGYGSFFMWADTDDKLLYLYEFNCIDDLSGSAIFDIVYNDDSIFDSLGYKNVHSAYHAYQTVSPSGCEVYLKNQHYYHSRNSATSSYWYDRYFSDEMRTCNTIENLYVSENDIYYHYNIDSLIGYVKIDNKQSGYKIGLTHDIYNESTEDNNEYYIYDTDYTSGNQQHNNNRELGVKIDLYTDTTKNYPENSFILDYGGIPQTDSGYYGDSGGLNFIRFNPDTFYSADPHQYFDYYVHDTYSEYNFFVTSVILHPNYPQGIEDYQNNVNNTMSGNHILLENEFTFVPNVYKLRLYATYSYPASVEDGILLAESNPISITAEYVPPYEPPIHPDDPPNATSINQTLNNSWSTAYYETVLSTNEFFYLPVYNFVTWLTLPVTDLTNNMNLYEDAMKDSFSTSTSEIAMLASSVNVIIGGIHPKIVNLMTYYLIWLILLVVLRKS